MGPSIMASQPGPKAAKHPCTIHTVNHYVRLFVWCSYMGCCDHLMIDVTGPWFLKVTPNFADPYSKGLGHQ